MCSFTCSTYFICIFSNVPYIFMCSFTVSMYSVFYMYFFTCSSIFMCSLTVSIFLCVPSHVPCIFYVFLHRFHVFLDMFTKACKSFSLSFLQQNNNLNGTRNHNLSCDLCALFLFNHCMQRKKKKESSGYLTKHTTEMDILVDVIIFS